MDDDTSLTGTLWTIEGPYGGIGPRGYRRPAGRIREEVCERLSRHRWVDASHVEVEVQDGEVTLGGTIPDRAQKRLAEDAALAVRGVWDVHNHLLLRRVGD